MNKSINDVVTEATYVMSAYVFIISQMVAKATGLGQQEAIAMTNLMVEKKSRELSSNLVETSEEIKHYVEACKRHLFGEENENE